MPRNPTILYSTTRMWNAGDDFILFGVRSLIRELLPASIPLVYNRNPDLHIPRLQLDRAIELKDKTTGQILRLNAWDMLLKQHSWRFDNSWRPHHGLEGIDYCIFAGTPEWQGPMVGPLTAVLAKSEIPVFYFGLGSFEKTARTPFEKLPADDQTLLSRAKIITVRDPIAAEMLRPLRPVQLPCPSLFAAPGPRQRGKLRRIALSTQGTTAANHQKVAPEIQKFTVELFRALAKEFPCELVCHYIDEVFELRKLLGDELPIRFSYDAKDYLEIYDEFDLTVTTRLHGAGLCASMGIPALLIAHSVRAASAEGFLAELVDPTSATPQDVVATIRALNIIDRSSALILHREVNRKRYLELLRPHFEA